MSDERTDNTIEQLAKQIIDQVSAMTGDDEPCRSPARNKRVNLQPHKNPANASGGDRTSRQRTGDRVRRH